MKGLYTAPKPPEKIIGSDIALMDDFSGSNL